MWWRSASGYRVEGKEKLLCCAPPTSPPAPLCQLSPENGRSCPAGFGIFIYVYNIFMYNSGRTIVLGCLVLQNMPPLEREISAVVAVSSRDENVTRQPSVKRTSAARNRHHSRRSLQPLPSKLAIMHTTPYKDACIIRSG